MGKCKLRRHMPTSIRHKCKWQYVAICETDTCEFVIWSPKGAETIKRDIEFCEELLPKLIAFHNNLLIPEFLEMRVPRRLMPTELQLYREKN
ncbi:hypothetical protein DPMN_038199 [Dreissena polymorpha]|uniref:Uncharacterized protein n=1 Tax=Dreissena polymorpha TaxID=45954 RepID=A0A9D4MCB1_DREPO|nr:hypothetical protein DPMN_038199 [Dreissena polymorpha]